MAPALAGPLDDLLIPFDPGRSLETVSDTLELYASADPKVAAARSLVEDHLGSLPDADLEAVAAVFWATYRRRLCAGARPSRVRDWLRNGDRVLWTIQVALDSSLSPSALADLAAAVRELETSDAEDARDLTIARAELASLLASDIGPPKLLGFIVVFGGMHAEHYIATHPSKPPAGPFPDDDD
jgi:hypothetical protein